MTRARVHVPPLDSPSKQLILDLTRDLENVRIFNAELKKVHAYERQTFYDNLDRIDREREAVHTAALDEAAAYHERVREEAEATLRAHNRAEEEARRRKEEAERKERERIEREKAEERRRQEEEAARIEQERKKQAEADKKAAEEAERARQAAQEARERQEREKQERLAAEARQKEEEARKAQQAAQQAAQKQSIGGSRLTSEEARIQERYVALHKTLKEMREHLRNIGKQNPAVKEAMGGMRRAIKMSVGQLRNAKGSNATTNKQQLNKIRDELKKAAAISEPAMDVRQFIAFPPESIAGSEQKAPALLIYGLNIFAKCLIASLLAEASLKPEHAEPIGIIAAQIFSTDEFMYQGIHMSDILWAKYRVVCPALWGFTGDEKTQGGRRALGWWRENPEGPFISEQAHLDRMTALGAGFSAITLRKFGQTQRQNPFPNTLFWTSLQKLVSMPPTEVQETQITLLYSMLRGSGERILGFFGQFGLVLMRKAIVDLPAGLTRQSMSVNQLKLLRETYQRDKNIIL
ncbi:hypothetical protein N7462_005370 [Penicillium macrosclerotiorum]|uniref:uncharacterized protein n=1 Tax=Penicillium macrosclerotiorum TaxID=303699 RepID=UPI002548D045|nr:uncharacterized protein N7462_005370 [Penicillium macrosclerotiorum]KAJ5682205.1 hypothetical protein N7462_005370 [Penicillium macrosclerotiorum]